MDPESFPQHPPEIDQPETVGGSSRPVIPAKIFLLILVVIIVVLIIIVTAIGISRDLISVKQPVTVQRVYTPSKAVARPVIKPTAIPTPIISPADKKWRIVLPKKSFKVEELSNPLTDSIPITATYGISGTLFTPLSQGEKICRSDSPGAYLEKRTTSGWIRLCDKERERSDTGTIDCWEEYDSSLGHELFASLTNSKNCNLQGEPIEDGIYRMKAKIYTGCSPNPTELHAWDNINPGSCRIKQDVISEEFSVSN